MQFNSNYNFLTDIGDDNHDILKCIAKLFDRFVYVDLETLTYEYVGNTHPQFNIIPDSGPYPVLLDYLLSMLIEQEARTRMSIALKPENLQETLSEGVDDIRFEYHIFRDKSYWEDLNVICLERKNNVATKVLITKQDVTHLKEAELYSRYALEEALRSAAAANHAKNVFLSKVSHEIRTPMNAIMGMTNITAMHRHDPERVMDGLNKINSASQHLLALINDILDMSKIESGKFFLSEEPINLIHCIEDASNFLLNKVGSDTQNLTFSTEKIKHPYVIGDPNRLQQVILNVVGNAQKFTPEHGSITVDFAETPSKNPEIACYTMTCKDTGIGMTNETISQIYDPFYRADNPCIKNTEGTGLGMPIVENIVHMMQGEIHIKSALGKGTTVTIIIFLRLADSPCDEHHNTISTQCNLSAISNTDLKEIRILVVEDNDLNAEIAEELLTSMNAQVELAYNGQDAIHMFLNHPENYYDLIFMDIQMPNMNGYEATKCIRSLSRADATSIPIISMTADAFPDDVERAKHAGMNDHIAKPISITSLINIVKKWS